MKRYKNRILLLLVIAVGSFIALVKGEEARQKWVFKIRSKYDNKRLIAEKKDIARKGGILLDDIELASYHTR